MSKANRNRNKHNNKAYREHVMGFTPEQLEALNGYIVKRYEGTGAKVFVGSIDEIIAFMMKQDLTELIPQA